MSGSVLHYANMSDFGVVNMLVTISMFCYCLSKRKITLMQTNTSISSILVIATGLGALIVMFLWSEFSFLKGYVTSYCLILMPWVLTRLINFNDFKNAYIKIMIVLVTISLLFYFSPHLLNLIPRSKTIITSRWNYDFYYIYARFHNAQYTILKRNIGIFWEAGMYQGFVIFAMALVALDEKINIRSALYQLLMTICIFTIQSTTGYLLLLPIVLIYALKIISVARKRLQVIMTVIIIAIVFIILLDNNILLEILNRISPDIVPKLNIENSSTSTRLYSTLIDLYLAVRNPFGIGLLEMDTLRAQAAGIMNLRVDGSNINTTFTMMLQYGMIPGMVFIHVIIKACMNMSDNKLICITMLVVSLVIINTEPHYLTIFFTTMFMYYAENTTIVGEYMKSEVI